jgi:hypothetical protein
VKSISIRGGAASAVEINTIASNVEEKELKVKKNGEEGAAERASIPSSILKTKQIHVRRVHLLT